MLTGGAQSAAARPLRPKTTFLSSLLFSFLIIHNFLVANGQQQPINESDALIVFKSSLANEDAVLASWNRSSAVIPCSGNTANWVGVLCFNGYVWGLQLENMNLRGQIDVDSLVPLRFLRTLSFMGNEFEGSMPDWRKLGALKSLFVSNNRFSGEIPADAFRGMTSLKKVYMANNGFTGHIPASLESPKLIELRLENNRFTGPIPAISSDNLKVLNVSYNQLEGPIPAPLSKMDPSSFAGNRALCGKPLNSACDPTTVPPSHQSDLDPSLNSDNRNKSPSIAIIIIPIVVGLLLIIFLAVCLYRRRKNRGSQTPQLGRAVVPSPPSDVTAVVAAGDRSPPKKIYSSEQNHHHGQPGKLSFVREDRGKFDLPDLMRASAEVLRSGSFGASYKAVLLDTGEALVVKRFQQMNSVAKEDFHEHMRRLGRLKHPNLLPLVAYLYRKEEKLLVFDYVCNGSLATHLHGKHSAEQPGLKWATRLKIIKGVAKGLLYLRNELPSLTVAHGHLKSSNVLLDKDFNPLLMDYALVPVVNSAQVHQILVAYKSPEYTQHGRTTKKTDVWCLGVLILEILTGKFLAQAGSPGDTAAWINGIAAAAAAAAGEDTSAKVFDEEMKEEISSCGGEMEKLLQIGIACCEEDSDKRWDLDEALRQIEQVQDDDIIQ